MKQLLAKFSYAFRGIGLALKDKSVIVQVVIMVLALVFFSFFDLSLIEWCVLLMCCGMVIVAEMFNTVIERMMNFIHPECDDRVRDIKDFGAGVVLAASIFALLIGILIIGSKII